MVEGAAGRGVLQGQPASSKARTMLYLIDARCWPSFPRQSFCCEKNRWSLGAQSKRIGDKFSEKTVIYTIFHGFTIVAIQNSTWNEIALTGTLRGVLRGTPRGALRGGQV